MSQLVQLEGKHSTQNAHCALFGQLDTLVPSALKANKFSGPPAFATFAILSMFHRECPVHVCFDKIKLLYMRSNQTARQRVAFYTTAVTAEFQRQLYNF